MRKIILTFIYLLLSSCANDRVYLFSGSTMGTTYRVKTLGISVNQIEIDKRLDEINAIFSTWDANSELSQLNKKPINQWIVVSENLFFVLQTAKKIHLQTNGAFDVGIGRLIDTWGFGNIKTKSMPNIKQINVALQHSSIKHLILKNGKVKKHKDIRLNLSAIAKGFAVDEVARLLAKKQIKHFLVEIGGEVKAQGKMWKIGIEQPNGQVPIAVELKNQAIASSGDYRNYIVWQGQQYQHILDPTTGLPAKTDLTAVSVIHASTMLADAYATAMMVMGSEKSNQLAKQLELEVKFILSSNFRNIPQ